MQVSRATHQPGLYRALGSRRANFAARATQLPTSRAGWFGYAEPKAPGRAALARTRFIQDQLRAAAAEGIGQVVWLGTAYTCPAEAAALRRFHIDELELMQLSKAGTHKLEMALEAAWSAQGFDATQRSVFVCDGLLERLDAPSVQRLLACIGQTCPGTRVVFTYLHRGLLDGSVRFDASQKPSRAVPRLGNAAQFGLDPRELPAFVSQLGLVLDCDLSADEYAKRSAQPSDGRRPDLRGYGFHRLACAYVIGRP